MFFKRNNTKTISTTIPEEIYNDVVKLGWKHNELYKLGYQIKKNNPVLNRVQEIEALEEKRKLETYSLRKQLFDLKTKLEVLQNGKRE